MDKIIHAGGNSHALSGDSSREILEGFNGSGKWWENYQSLQEARQVAGKMWHCTDIIPRAGREEIADYLEVHLGRWSEIPNNIRSVASYAQVARILLKIMP